MWRRGRVPLGVVAVALFGLLVLLAFLQYRWLGQISDADRAQRTARLEQDAFAFAQDFDRELTRAYLLFQGEPIGDMPQDDLASRIAQRYDNWHSTSSFPRLLKEVYAFSQTEEGTVDLRRFDPATRRMDAAQWPESMSDWREQIATTTQRQTDNGRGSMFVRRMPSAVWERVPALVVPSASPMVFFSTAVKPSAVAPGATSSLSAALMQRFGVPPVIAYTILVIDKDYVVRELVPTLARRHFSQQPDGVATDAALDYKVAIVARGQKGAPIFQSAPSFAPAFDDAADARAELFQVRTQDFTGVVAEVRKLTAMTSVHGLAEPGVTAGRLVTSDSQRPLSFVFQQSAPPPPGVRGTATTTARVTAGGSAALWRVIVAHPSGSLERAVNAARVRNLGVSFGILAILGASMGLLVLTTRRSQRLAQQQMEFVATVSHELRTPLAVIRSAADNLAEGVVHDEQRIRRYGELMRSEGRRLTEMVEQILEFAGIQSGQRGFALRPVAIAPMVGDILSSSASLIDEAGLAVEVDLPADLPAVLGDEPALRRVFQNLIDNAIKYGATGKWLKVSARASGSSVAISVSDRGIGIEPAEQSRIFEPFYRAAAVVAAQMQGAGLGLSLVQRIVAAHGGSVTVKSVPRSGSEFVVHLPAAKHDPVAAAAGVESTAAAPRYS